MSSEILKTAAAANIHKKICVRLFTSTSKTGTNFPLHFSLRVVLNSSTASWNGGVFHTQCVSFLILHASYAPENQVNVDISSPVQCCCIQMNESGLIRDILT